MGSRDERIANLASTLKASGLAKSEVQAKMMAEEMIGVEENVQKRYDEEHAKAQEFLRTAKNLGDPRVRPAPVQPQEPQKEQQYSGRRIEPLKTSFSASVERPIESPISKPVDDAPKKSVVLEDVYTDVNLGAGSLKDLMLNQINEDKHEVKNIEELKSVGNIDDIKDDMKNDIKENIKNDMKHDYSQAIPEVSQTVVDVPKQEDVSKQDDIPSSGLDGNKLAEMMEEDGPLEEHTREIKEKPKNVKPKEDYVENTVDLSNMFNVNKK